MIKPIKLFSFLSLFFLFILFNPETAQAYDTYNTVIDWLRANPAPANCTRWVEVKDSTTYPDQDVYVVKERCDANTSTVWRQEALFGGVHIANTPGTPNHGVQYLLSACDGTNQSSSWCGYEPYFFNIPCDKVLYQYSNCGHIDVDCLGRTTTVLSGCGAGAFLVLKTLKRS